MKAHFRNLKTQMVGLMLILIAASAQGQQMQVPYGWVLPRESPPAKVSQTVGVTEIAISYHRPALKDRTIETNYLPFGKVWRAGANEATTISFSTDVTIEGKPLAAGTYGLFMIPGKTEWTVIFNKTSKQWGAFTYDETKDALRVTVAAQAGENVNRLQYSFPVVTDNTAQAMMQWGTIRIPFTISVDLEKTASAKALTSFDWSAGWFAADFFYQRKTNLEEALRWINASIAMNENPSNLFLKAKILAEMGRHEEAIQIAEKIQVPNRQGSDRLKANLEKAVSEWRKAMADRKKQ
ncbi:MAG: DUF2911 domain-containing protein [Acidobacteriota bacterium]